MSRHRPAIQFALFALGAGLFALSVKAAGLEQLRAYLPALGASAGLPFVIYPFMCFWDALGWQALFSMEARPHIRFWKLYSIRMAGEAVNNLTPFLDVGGEYLKVVLVSEQFGLSKKKAFVSAVMARSALFFSEILFWVMGLVAALFIFKLPVQYSLTLSGTAAIFAALGAIIVLAQRKGLFRAFLDWFRHLRIPGEAFGRFEASLTEADHDIASFYSGRDGRILLSTLLHLAGWAAGGIEVYVMLRVLGADISWGGALMMESLLQLVKTASFFIPGNLGAQEMGLAFFCQSLGMHPSVGVALSLLKRVRQLIWTGAGFALIGLFRVGEPSKRA